MYGIPQNQIRRHNFLSRLSALTIIEMIFITHYFYYVAHAKRITMRMAIG